MHPHFLLWVSCGGGTWDINCWCVSSGILVWVEGVHCSRIVQQGSQMKLFIPGLDIGRKCTACQLYWCNPLRCICPFHLPGSRGWDRSTSLRDGRLLLGRSQDWHQWGQWSYWAGTLRGESLGATCSVQWRSGLKQRTTIDETLGYGKWGWSVAILYNWATGWGTSLLLSGAPSLCKPRSIRSCRLERESLRSNSQCSLINSPDVREASIGPYTPGGIKTKLSKREEVCDHSQIDSSPMSLRKVPSSGITYHKLQPAHLVGACGNVVGQIKLVSQSKHVYKYVSAYIFKWALIFFPCNPRWHPVFSAARAAPKTRFSARTPGYLILIIFLNCFLF
jgi:hypothetical protein